MTVQELFDSCDKLGIIRDPYLATNKPLGIINEDEINYIIKLRAKLALSGINMSLRLNYLIPDKRYIIEIINLTSSDKNQSEDLDNILSLLIKDKTQNSLDLYMGLDKNIAYLQLDLLSRSGLTTALDAVINIQKHEKLATDHGMSSIFTFRNKSIALSYIALNHCVYYLYLKAVSNGSYQTTQTPKLYNFVRDTKNITQLLLRPIRSAIDLFDKDFGNNPIDSSNIKEVLADIDYIEEMIVHMLKAKIAIDLVNLYRENNVEFTDFNTNYVSASRMDDLISRSDLVTIYKSSIYDLKSKISIRAEQTNNIQPENIQATIRMFSLFVSTTSLPLRYIDYAYIDDLKIRGNKSATFNQLITDTWKIIHELK